jgi:hypothetical protein
LIAKNEKYKPIGALILLFLYFINVLFFFPIERIY